MEERIDYRKELLDELMSDKRRYLDYLVRLWGYIIENNFSGNYDCAFVFVDNIDRASNVVQTKLVNILYDCSQDPGPTFVVNIRPETLDRLGLKDEGRGALIIDVLQHDGPKPSEVVVDRFNEFLSNPDSYCSDDSGIDPKEFIEFKNYMNEVKSVIFPRGRKESPYLKRLDDTSGDSSRFGLLTAQKLIYLNENDYRSEDFSAQSLVRSTIYNQGKIKFSKSSTSPIENLFDVEGINSGRFLVKPRILSYLINTQGKSCILNDLNFRLNGFGYKLSATVYMALNELMSIYRPLLWTNGFEHFENIREFENSGYQKIVLTKIGKAYGENILEDIHYVQEVMLDCIVPSSRFGEEIAFSNTTEKLLVLSRFLKELLLSDIRETRDFCHSLTLKDYYTDFGNYLLTFKIIWQNWNSVIWILDKIRKDIGQAISEETLYLHEEIESQFESLVLEAAEHNRQILNIYPRVVAFDKRLDKSRFK